MTEYYFIGTLLPDLELGEIPELSFEQLEKLLLDNLKPADYKRALQLRRVYSLENLRAWWLNKPLDAYGCDAHDVEELYLEYDAQPSYLRDFLEKYDTQEERLRFFPELLSKYYQEESQKAQGFVKEYIEFERKLRLIQTAFRSKRLNRDLAIELKFEEPEDPFIQELVSQKDDNHFEAPKGFEEVKALLEEHYHAPMELYKALTLYRFKTIEELAGHDLFSIERILSYMMQLIMVENWQETKKVSKTVDLFIKESA